MYDCTFDLSNRPWGPACQYAARVYVAHVHRRQTHLNDVDLLVKLVQKVYTVVKCPILKKGPLICGDAKPFVVEEVVIVIMSVEGRWQGGGECLGDKKCFSILNIDNHG